MTTNLRAGIGYDVHELTTGRDLILGGVTIPHSHGLKGHSDADVLTHAIMDALLGAASLGDIGTHFPDNDPQYRGISSIKLLEKVSTLLNDNSVKIINIDSVIMCQSPKIMPFASEMKNNIAQALNLADDSHIGIKATTTEGLGFVGRKEGIAAQAVCLLNLQKI